ncbi:MAG TPA: hypothetical protein VMT88_09855 [Actinomycetes bacterium]|nr:hypothetical protein [Actinomycetes bacterium]
MPWLSSHTLALRDEAIEKVGPLLAPFGRFVRLDCPDAHLAAFVARPLAGALDQDRSEIVRFRSSGEGVKRIENVHFRSDAVASQGVFCLPEFIRGPLYLTEDLVDRIIATNHSSGTVFAEISTGRATFA